MNICFLEGDMSRHGGTERMTAIISRALCSEKNRVFILSLSLKEKEVFFDLDHRVTHIALNKSDENIRIVKQIRIIHQFIKKEKIDVVVNVDVGMGIYGILASLRTDAKTITWEHANYFNNWGSKIFPYFRKFAAKYSGAMVVLTEQDKDNYKRNIQTLKPIYVIPNPIQCHQYIYNPNSKMILSAGLLSPIKGFDIAIQVAAKVLPQYPDWTWIICGEGPERKHLENMIEKYKLQNQVILKGNIQNIEKQYQKAAMFVMTSQMEGLPMVLLEAKSWGIPLISFDIMTGPSDIIRNGINGYLVKERNVDEMAARIVELIEEQDKRKSFSAASQKDMNKFEMKEITEKWKRVIRNLIEK